MLEELPEAVTRDLAVPRASLVLAEGAIPGLRGNLWMGGAHSLAGEALELAALARAVVIDCAGDMPGEYRTAAALWLANVFQDVDTRPTHLDRLEANARRAATALHDAGQDVYAMCTHGMNRSGLAAGLVLRALGVEGIEAVRLITAARPGALSNETYRGILQAAAPNGARAKRA